VRLRTAVVTSTGIGVAVGAGVMHAAPALTAISPLRRHLLPHLAGVGRPGHVALTFDDGPDPSSTPAFLDVLDGLGWRATFFMLGDMVRRAPGLAAEVAAAGHEVAVHGEIHRSMLWRAPWSVVDDVARGRDAVADATGVEPRFFRPPFGMLSGGALRAAARSDLDTVLWTAWGRDWRPEATPESVTEDVMRGHLDGGTVLLHDSDCTSSHGSWRSALGALPVLADEFAPRDLQVGTLGEHFAA
jgi:peptidoglycan/xylan/chitin deacetylase (PgdA/CDA1 family)